jgi:hypothetical protein
LVIPIPIELLKPFQAAFGPDASTFDQIATPPQPPPSGST